MTSNNECILLRVYHVYSAIYQETVRRIPATTMNIKRLLDAATADSDSDSHRPAIIVNVKAYTLVAHTPPWWYDCVQTK